jgi:hypothetical protein
MALLIRLPFHSIANAQFFVLGALSNLCLLTSEFQELLAPPFRISDLLFVDQPLDSLVNLGLNPGENLEAVRLLQESRYSGGGTCFAKTWSRWLA